MPNPTRSPKEGVSAATVIRQKNEAIIARPTVTNSREQNVAIEMVLTWLKDKGSKKRFVIAGYAGTGKTRVISEIVAEASELGKRVGVAAFTNKAVAVLREKGVQRAITCHRMLYELSKNSGEERVWQQRRKVEYDLVIVDEGSMVSAEIERVLDSLNVKVLYLGDPAQLEPVGNDPNIMLSPDFTMTKIHRQSENNPIILLTQEIREGRTDLVNGLWKNEDGTGSLLITDSATDAPLANQDMVVCGYNRTRHEVNKRKREILGYSESPQIGESLVCLRNERDTELYNGLVVTVRARGDNLIDGTFKADLYEETEGVRRNISIDTKFLGNDYKSNEYRGPVRSHAVPFDYASCLTAHKMQGSEYHTVLAIEEVLRGEHRRLLYTMVTRASHHLTLVRHASRRRNSGNLSV